MLLKVNRTGVVGLLVVLLSTSFGVVSCDRGIEPLVLYVSADEYVARPLVARFSERTGIPVHLVGDTEANKTTGLVDRLRAERDRPVADVFWSSEAMMTIALAQESLLRPHESETTADWPEPWRDPSRLWYGFSPRPRVLVTDPAVLDAEALPRSLGDLCDEKWKGRLVMADPRFGTTGGHLAALRSWHQSRGEMVEFNRWLSCLGANQIRILPGGNAAVVDEVRAGRALIGFTDADDVRAANRLGADLEMHPLGPVAEVGTFLMPNTVALVKGNRHPYSGEMMDFLLSEEVAIALARSASGNIPLQPDVAADFPELVVPDPMQIDLSETAASYQLAVGEAIGVFNQDAGDVAP